MSTRLTAIASRAAMPGRYAPWPRTGQRSPTGRLLYRGIALVERGDTTEAMLERFDTDVLPFHPQVLVIMGGVNDFRAGTLGWDTVGHLAAIRDKCKENGIIPVFSTVTPINPGLIALRGMIEMPPGDWQVHREYINNWVMQQPYHVDAAGALADESGNLRAESTTDGLHPDEAGKRRIGETIGRYLREKFPSVAGN